LRESRHGWFPLVIVWRGFVALLLEVVKGRVRNPNPYLLLLLEAPIFLINMSGSSHKRSIVSARLAQLHLCLTRCCISRTLLAIKIRVSSTFSRTFPFHTYTVYTLPSTSQYTPSNKKKNYIDFSISNLKIINGYNKDPLNMISSSHLSSIRGGDERLKKCLG
jgi:hypothetical protein